jgi:2-polyprenyl-3-methyl-5-hydroxy-6-metoxy-1,4-benzoquinol methylase
MTQQVQQFYDDLAESYHFIFANWKESVLRQASILHQLLETQNEPPPKTLLDCTCGVGTQAIALATQGYLVHGTDLSPKAIVQAKENTSQFETDHPPAFAVADLLQPPSEPQQYDIVISCDNAIAHFHTDAELSQAIVTMLMQLKPHGLLLISLRDYDAALENPPQQTPIYITDEEQGRRLVFQLWEWTEDYRSYHLQMFIMNQENDNWHTRVFKSHLRALKRQELELVLKQNGLQDIQWHMPTDSNYYQPIVTARKSTK